MEKIVARAKDSSPEVTVRCIKDRLEQAGIPVGHQLYPAEIPGCFSAHVALSGSLEAFIGTNGKGTTESFCLASGYAEMMERIQNLIFLYGPHYLDHGFISELESLIPKREDRTWDELYKADPYINSLLARCMESMTDIPNWLRRKTAENQLRLTCSDFGESVPTVPYYHVNSGRYIPFPEKVARLFNLSNGMAAGNTLEEALVQGLSELFERRSQMEIMLRKLTPPELPAETIARYPSIQKLISDIEHAGLFRIRMCDASLGEGYPVVCGIIINTRTQTFGVRFGAHPNLGIAMERVITESLQGKSLEQFSRYSTVMFSEAIENNYKNIFNSQKTGQGIYPASFLGPSPSWEYSGWNWDGEAENTELACEMARFFQDKGFDLFIRDTSFLGFPSVCVTIPGVSEIVPPTHLFLKELKLRFSVCWNMLHIDRLDDAQVRQILVYCKAVRGDVLQNTVIALYMLPFTTPFPGSYRDLDFLMAVCHYRLGELDRAYRYMQACRLGLLESDPQFAYVHLAESFILGRLKGCDSALLESYLRTVGDAPTVTRLLYDFGDPLRVLEKLYPHFEDFDELGKDDTACPYLELREFYRKLFREMNRNDVSTERLHLLFGEGRTAGTGARTL